MTLHVLTTIGPKAMTWDDWASQKTLVSGQGDTKFVVQAAIWQLKKVKKLSLFETHLCHSVAGISGN